MSARRTAPYLLAALLAGACDADPVVAPPWEIDDRCRFAAINTDYASTSVALLRADGAVCAAAFLDSGARRPGLVTALSGDVVLPTTPHPEGLLVLIDRYPAAVLTLVAPTGEVVRQLPVGTGYPSNPHDALVFAADRAWVTRYDANPTPTPDAADHDEGGDVLIVDPAAGAILGRVALGALASPGMEPRPDRLARVGERVWVTLGNLSRAFDDAGPGRVAALDAETGAVVGHGELTGLASCGGELAPAPGGAWVSCTGVFASGERAQLAASGVAWLEADAEGVPVEAFRLGALSIGPARPLGSPIAALDAARVVVVSLGTLEGEPDTLWLVDRERGSASALGVSGEAFALNALLVAVPGELLVGDASRKRPKLLRYGLDLGVTPPSAEALGATITDPVSRLEPRVLARFR